MSKPTPGMQYLIQERDSWQSIAAQAYGDATLFTRIQKANQSGPISADPVPGQIIVIPRLSENEEQKNANAQLQIVSKKKDELTIIINGIELAVESATIFTAVDNLADGWVAQIAWIPGEDPSLDANLLPYSYAPASVYIGNELIINGLIYMVGNSLVSDRSIKTIQGWSFTADMIDSNLKPPYEEAQVTLRGRAESLVKPLGLNVIYDLAEDEFFDRVTAKATDTIFGHLSKLAAQRGALITSTPEGDVLFTKADASRIVGTLQEGDPTVTAWNATFDGRKRFNIYKAIGQSPNNNAKTAIATDDKVPRSRFHTFSVDDTTDGNIQQAADWRRSKQIAETLSIPLPVSSWFAPDGSLYRKNTGITVIAPSLHVPDGFTFLIRAVEYELTSSGRKAVLHLIPPEAYSGEPIIEPWS